MSLLRNKLYIICIIILVTVTYNTEAQERKAIEQLSYQINYNHSYIFDHRSSMKYVIEKPVHAINFNFNIQTNNNSEWAKYWRYPKIIIGYYFANLGNTQNLGYINAIYPGISIPIIKNEKLQFNYNIAVGLAYFNKIFDSDENYLNPSIGSHLNGYYNFGFDLKFKVNNNLYLIPDFSLVHFSNGFIKTPNLGINLITFKMGAEFAPNETTIPHNKQKETIQNKNEISGFCSIGIKELNPPEGKKYLTSTLTIDYNRIVSNKRKFGFGIDVFYDKSIAEKLYRDSINYTELSQIIYPGIHLSHIVKWGNLDIVMQVGTPIWSYWEKNSNLYERLGFRYFINERYILNITFKANRSIADYVEWGFGYIILK